MIAIHLHINFSFYIPIPIKIVYYDLNNLFKKKIIFIKYRYMILLQRFSKTVLKNIELLSKKMFQS